MGDLVAPLRRRQSCLAAGSRTTRFQSWGFYMLWFLAGGLLAAWMVEVYRLTSIEYDWEYNQDDVEAYPAPSVSGRTMTSTEGVQGDEPMDCGSDDAGAGHAGQ